MPPLAVEGLYHFFGRLGIPAGPKRCHSFVFIHSTSSKCLHEPEVYNTQASCNEPVLMEEFGATADQNQTTTYENWYSTIIDSGLTGVLNW